MEADIKLVKLEDELIIKAYESAKLMAKKYEKRPDRWGKGNVEPVYIDLLKETPPKHIMTFVPGLMGEFALQKVMIELGYSDFPAPDLTVYKKGDGGRDFTYRDIIYQIKCTSNSFLPLLIKRQVPTEDGGWKELPLTFDKIISACHRLNTNLVSIHGWSTKEAVAKLPVKPGRARNSDWKNIEVPLYKLQPIETLIG